VSTLKEICKEQTELLNECRQNIKELTEENEKLQENNEQLVENNDKLNEIFSYQENKKKELRKEREKLNDKLNQAYEDGYQMEGKYRDMKTQRDTLIDDIAVIRANNERLERENEQKTKVISLYKKAYEKTHKGWFRYRELTNHIRDMKFASPYSYNYIHLVNFIKELEDE
jgi:chromosome segregation ATPase